MIVPLEELNDYGGILLHGCMDLVHIGHIRHIKEASRLHPHLPLTVTITADKHITKGPGRPAFPAEVRAEWLDAIKWVNYVAIVDEPTGLLAINTIKPFIYVKGGEYAEKGVLQAEKEAVERHGGRVYYTKDHQDGISSTSILTGQYLRNRQTEQKYSNTHE